MTKRNNMQQYASMYASSLYLQLLEPMIADTDPLCNTQEAAPTGAASPLCDIGVV